MTPQTQARWISLVAYTALRIALLVAVWGLLVWLTPMDGLIAVVMAILVSGIISIPLLSHQRDMVSVGVAAFFRRMNERIDASARAEDDDDASGQREQQPEQDAVAKDE